MAGPARDLVAKNFGVHQCSRRCVVGKLEGRHGAHPRFIFSDLMQNNLASTPAIAATQPENHLEHQPQYRTLWQPVEQAAADVSRRQSHISFRGRFAPYVGGYETRFFEGLQGPEALSRSAWTVIAGSGTGELVGIAGKGSYAAKDGVMVVLFTYDLDSRA